MVRFFDDDFECFTFSFGFQGRWCHMLQKRVECRSLPWF